MEDAMLILTSIFIGAFAGLAYGGWNYITKTDPGSLEIKRLIASMLFGLGIGFVAAYTVITTGVVPTSNDWWLMVGSMFVLYSGFQVYVNRFVDYIWERYYGKKFMGKASFSLPFEPGFMVTPAFPEGKSPFIVALDVTVSPSKGDHQVTQVIVDWGDETPAMSYVPDGGKLLIGHAYVYNQAMSPKYTGHTFYPRFTLRTKDGIIKTFNTKSTGRCCAVGVEAGDV